MHMIDSICKYSINKIEKTWKHVQIFVSYRPVKDQWNSLNAWDQKKKNKCSIKMSKRITLVQKETTEPHHY